jgi:cell wall-associated NlpC family hydrolase
MVSAEATVMSTGDRIAQAARASIGTRYRPQGSTSAGVDCVGLVLVALARAGRPLAVEQSYPRRFHARGEAEARLLALGFRAIDAAEQRPGDIVLTEPVPGQLHFGIMTATGMVEAHAGLRRVVERPLRADERILSIWRVA